MQFVVEIVQAIAWPAAIVAILLIVMPREKKS